MGRVHLHRIHHAPVAVRRSRQATGSWAPAAGEPRRIRGRMGVVTSSQCCVRRVCDRVTGSQWSPRPLPSIVSASTAEWPGSPSATSSHRTRASYERHRYLAGTDDVRTAALIDAFSDPGNLAVVCARGGIGRRAAPPAHRLQPAPAQAAGRLLGQRRPPRRAPVQRPHLHPRARRHPARRPAALGLGTALRTARGSRARPAHRQTAHPRRRRGAAPRRRPHRDRHAPRDALAPGHDRRHPAPGRGGRAAVPHRSGLDAPAQRRRLLAASAASRWGSSSSASRGTGATTHTRAARSWPISRPRPTCPASPICPSAMAT